YGDLGVSLGKRVVDRRELLLVHDPVHVREVDRQRLVEQRTAERRLDEDGVALGPALRGTGPLGVDDVVHADLDLRTELEVPRVERHDRLGDRGERAALARGALDRKTTRLNSSHVK